MQLKSSMWLNYAAGRGFKSLNDRQSHILLKFKEPKEPIQFRTIICRSWEIKVNILWSYDKMQLKSSLWLNSGSRNRRNPSNFELSYVG